MRYIIITISERTNESLVTFTGVVLFFMSLGHDTKDELYNTTIKKCRYPNTFLYTHLRYTGLLEIFKKRRSPFQLYSILLFVSFEGNLFPGIVSFFLFYLLSSPYRQTATRFDPFQYLP